jgi:hypothetical protein
MKVLIVGDFSSSGHFLARGFKTLGINVTHIAYQNGWRENLIEINLTSPHKGIIGRLDNYIRPFRLSNLKGYDAVVFLDYFPFPRTFGINSIITKQIQDNNKASFFWVMGCDSKFREWGRNDNFDMCNPCLMYDQKSLTCRHENEGNIEAEFLKGIDKILPATYEYYQAHKDDPKVGQMIQVPVYSSEPLKPYKGEGIRIFHGLNRYGFKGTHIVESVFSDMEKKYVNVQFLIKGKMPFTDYVKLMAEQNIIVDQLFNKCLGMNSLLTLAQGKLLIAGDPSPSCDFMNVPVPPMVISEPSIVGLKRSLEYAMQNAEKLYEYQEEGLEYIKKYHAPEVVARKFVDVFGW